MTTNALVALDKKTVTVGGVATLEFTSVPQNYTDLVIVGSVKIGSNGNYIGFQFNGDTTGSYGRTRLEGNGTTAVSEREAGSVRINMYNQSNSVFGSNTIHIMNYSKSTTNKTVVSRNDISAWNTNAQVAMWSKTEAITSIQISGPGDFAIGTTFSLYGIKAWAPEATPKATGGYVYEDSTYWYHTFPFSGTFVPNQSLTCDYLVVAGGGGGGSAATIVNGGRGGGGAGGLFTGSVALTATNYTVTIGAGGVGGTGGTESDGVSGSNSQFAALTAIGGGYGSRANANAGNGGSGGGAGAWDDVTLAGTGTAGQGNNGGVGTGATGPQTYSGGGGGGFGSAGTAAGSLTVGGNGGLGHSSSISGFLQSFAGGGAGGNYQDGRVPTGGSGVGGNGKAYYVSTPAGNGAVSTGSGGGGGCGGHTGLLSGGSGGSGVVIIRYTKA